MSTAQQRMFQNQLNTKFRNLREAFRSIDKDFSGTIDADEMRKLCEHFHLDPDSVQKLIFGDGEARPVNFKEFAAAIKKNEQDMVGLNVLRVGTDLHMKYLHGEKEGVDQVVDGDQQNQNQADRTLTTESSPLEYEPQGPYPPHIEAYYETTGMKPYELGPEIPQHMLQSDYKVGYPEQGALQVPSEENLHPLFRDGLLAAPGSQRDSQKYYIHYPTIHQDPEYGVPDPNAPMPPLHPSSKPIQVRNMPIKEMPIARQLHNVQEQLKQLYEEFQHMQEADDIDQQEYRDKVELYHQQLALQQELETQFEAEYAALFNGQDQEALQNLQAEQLHQVDPHTQQSPQQIQSQLINYQDQEPSPLLEQQAAGGIASVRPQTGARPRSSLPRKLGNNLFQNRSGPMQQAQRVGMLKYQDQRQLNRVAPKNRIGIRQRGKLRLGAHRVRDAQRHSYEGVTGPRLRRTPDQVLADYYAVQASRAQAQISPMDAYLLQQRYNNSPAANPSDPRMSRSQSHQVLGNQHYDLNNAYHTNSMHSVSQHELKKEYKTSASSSELKKRPASVKKKKLIQQAKKKIVKNKDRVGSMQLGSMFVLTEEPKPRPNISDRDRKGNIPLGSMIPGRPRTPLVRTPGPYCFSRSGTGQSVQGSRQDSHTPSMQSHRGSSRQMSRNASMPVLSSTSSSSRRKLRSGGSARRKLRSGRGRPSSRSSRRGNSRKDKRTNSSRGGIDQLIFVDTLNENVSKTNETAVAGQNPFGVSENNPLVYVGDHSQLQGSRKYQYGIESNRRAGYIPGYTGHLPTRDEQIGRTYGDVTRDIVASSVDGVYQGTEEVHPLLGGTA